MSPRVGSAAVPLDDVTERLAACRPGWSPLDALAAVGITRSFVSGDPGGDRLRVRYFRRDDDGALVGRVWFGPGAEGPPGHVHGGSMAAVLDEAMGASAWLAGHPVVAVQITIQFRAMVRLGALLTFEADVVRVDGRKVATRGVLLDDDGVCRGEGEGLFIRIDPAALRARMEITGRGAR